MTTTFRSAGKGHQTLAFIACLLLLSLGGRALGQIGNIPSTSKDARTEPLKRGVTVTGVAQGHGGAEAGLRKGDILFTWSRGNLHGQIDSPFRFWWLECTQKPLGKLEIQGLRGSQPKTWVPGPDFLGVVVRPNFNSSLQEISSEGQRLASANDLHRALEAFRASVNAVQGPPWLRLWLQYRAAFSLLAAGKKQAAEALYRETATEARRTDMVAYATIMRVWGNQLWEKGEWSQAQSTYKEAISAFQANEQDRLFVTSFFNALMVNATILGDLAEAEEYARAAVTILESTGRPSIEFAMDLQALGIMMEERGELAQSEQYQKRALAMTRKLQPFGVLTANTLTTLGNLEEERGDLVQAEAYYREALRILPSHTHEIMDLTGTLKSLSDLESAVGNYKKAGEYGRWALALARKLGLNEDIAPILGDLGMVAMELHHPVAAEQYYRQSVATYERYGLHNVDFANILLQLGETVEQRGRMDEAEGYYREAMELAGKLAPKSSREAMILAALGRLTLHNGRIKAAGEFYRQAVESLESQTGRLGGGNDIRAGFRAQHESVYRGLIGVLIEQHEPTAAFEVVERSRARTLLEMLAAAHVDVQRGADPGLLKRERRLRADINAKSERRIQLLSDKHTDEQVKAVEKEISELTAQYQEVEAHLRSASPNYAALTQPQPLTAKEIQQQLLDRDTLLLEYSLGKERSHVFAVTPDSLQVFELPGRDRVERQARRVYRLLTARNHSVPGETLAQRERRWRQADAAYQREARKLSQMVLGPVAAQMGNKRLLIVADGALYYIPFAALPEPDQAKKSSLPLAVNHEIVSLPSASVLALLRQQYKNRKPAPQAVAVLADPVFDKNDPRVSEGAKGSGETHASAQSAAVRGAKQQRGEDDLFSGSLSAGLLTRSAADLGLRRNGRLTFSRLRYTREEADAIRAVTPPSQLLEAVDFRASRATATSPELADYRIVHFATHGLLNSRHPELSGLVLSLVDKNGKPQDGFLTLQDIYNMNLSADLVVLSACETGLGKEISGEGLIGMTRGFMYAGASRVVASLWNVSDVATARLMAEFYRGMEEDGLSPAAALRAAQVKMWKQPRWRSPYYWAAFQIQGEWR